MSFFKKMKPRKVSFDIATLKPDQIIYACKTRVLDKVITERKGNEFNEDTADSMDQHTAYYFIVDNQLRYSVVSSVIVIAWLKAIKWLEPDKNTKSELEQTHFYKATFSDQPPAKDTGALKCFNHYINGL